MVFDDTTKTLLVESVEKRPTHVKSSENCCFQSWFPKIFEVCRTSRENGTSRLEVAPQANPCPLHGLAFKMWKCGRDEGVFDLHINFSSVYMHVHVDSKLFTCALKSATVVFSLILLCFLALFCHSTGPTIRCSLSISRICPVINPRFGKRQSLGRFVDVISWRHLDFIDL